MTASVLPLKRMTPAQQAVAAHMSEAELQRQVMDLARDLGYQQTHHVWDSRRDAAGWPDLVLLRPGAALFWELKTEKGRIRPPQRTCLDLLASAGCTTAVVRPSDLLTGWVLRQLVTAGTGVTST